MREVRQTFEHLVVILGVFLICLLIIFSIPGVRIWFFENAPAAVASLAGPGATSKLMAGVDPKLLASAINDNDTRENLIKLWKQSIPEMNPDAVAELANELLADPNFSAMIVDVTAELDENSVAQLGNALISDPAIADFIVALLPRLDHEGISTLLNKILASEHAVSLTKSLVYNTDAVALGNLINEILANDNQVLSNLMTDLLGEIDTEKAAALVNEMAQDEVMMTQLDSLVGSLDTTVLSDFLSQLISQPDVQKFTKDMLTAIKPGTAFADLLNNPQSGLRKGLYGDPQLGDALLDWLWLEIRTEKVVTAEGITLSQHIKEHTLAILKPILDPIGLLIGKPDLYSQVADVIGSQVEALLVGGTAYLRFPDLFYGTAEDFEKYYAKRYPQAEQQRIPSADPRSE